MTISLPRLLLVVGGFVACLSSSIACAGVRAGYKAPLFTVPYTNTPPTIDGVVSDAEWKNSLGINALQTTEGNVSTRQTTFRVMWDADNVYLAMRSPLRSGEKVIQANRQLGRDNSKVVFDDSYEIWLNADTKSPDGEPVFFQYLGNAAGAKYDVMFEPAVGNSRPGWESGWKPANRITPDGKYWEMEVAIPRSSLYRDTPFTDGTELHGLFVRNFKGPWEQNSVGGSGSFSVGETHCRFILSKTAPAIQLLGVTDPATKTFGVKLAASSSADQTLRWVFESDSKKNQTGELQLTAGKIGVADPGFNLDQPGEGYFRIQVTSGDAKTTYLDWSSRRAFGDFEALTKPVPPLEPASLSLTFNPVRNYVRVEGDFINYKDRKNIHRFSAEVLDGQGKPLAQKDLQLDDLGYVHGLLEPGDLPAGSYIARLTCFDGAGKEVLRKDSSFVKKDPAKEFPWWNTTAGNIEKVIAPWTPIKHEGSQLQVWGRTMTVGDSAGLPAQVTTQGREILAGPMTLIADTVNGPLKSTPAKVETMSTADNRVVVASENQLGDLAISSRVITEFDGMYKVVLKLSPQKPVAIHSLKIVIPIKPEFAQYFHACGEGIRYGFSYGYVPQNKTGRLWASSDVDGQPMLVGSFVPYVWIGNDKGGLCWFADSDQGWNPDAKIPAMEIRRDSPDHVDLVLNLIGSNATMDQARTITFAFQATPVKPLQQGWRMETWSTADTFRDYCRVEPKGGHLIWDALPFTLDTAACKKMVDDHHKETTAGQLGVDKYHLSAVPYFENNSIDAKFVPESTYFGDEWHASVSDSLCFGKTLTDFIVYNLGKWSKETGIDGWYVDNVRPVACDNIDAGRGYRLPDGRIQPTYQMFATREHFLRVRAVFAENGKTGKFVLHMTNHMIMPWIGAADVALDGEDHVTFPEMGKDFIDFWSPARMRLDYPAQSGVAVTFLQEYQGKWTQPDIHRVMRAYTAMNILNDILPGGNPNGNNHEVWQGRDRFGIESPDVTFIPYWNKQGGIMTDGDKIYASAWKKPGSVLIAIVNVGDATTASVHIDATKLGLPAGSDCTALDADTGKVLPMEADGSLHVPVNRHDYRQVMISSTK